jgi:hypothetical protein
LLEVVREKREILFEEVACLAYDLFERRGKAHGYALQDWLEAERIVMDRYSGEIAREAEAISLVRKTKAKGAAKIGEAKKKAAASGTVKKKTAVGKKAMKKTE